MTIEEKAASYAERAFSQISTSHATWQEVKQSYAQAYLDALKSQWREVDADNPLTLPDEGQITLCRLDDGDYLVARYEGVDVYELGGEEYRTPEWWVESEFESYCLGDEVTHWMRIPEPPMKGGEA